MQDDTIFCLFSEPVSNGTLVVSQLPGETTLKMGGKWCNIRQYHRNGAGDRRFRIHCDLTSPSGAETL